MLNQWQFLCLRTWQDIVPFNVLFFVTVWSSSNILVSKNVNKITVLTKVTGHIDAYLCRVRARKPLKCLSILYGISSLDSSYGPGPASTTVVGFLLLKAVNPTETSKCRLRIILTS